MSKNIDVNADVHHKFCQPQTSHNFYNFINHTLSSFVFVHSALSGWTCGCQGRISISIDCSMLCLVFVCMIVWALGAHKWYTFSPFIGAYSLHCGHHEHAQQEQSYSNCWKETSRAVWLSPGNQHLHQSQSESITNQGLPQIKALVNQGPITPTWGQIDRPFCVLGTDR